MQGMPFGYATLDHRRVYDQQGSCPNHYYPNAFK